MTRWSGKHCMSNIFKFQITSSDTNVQKKGYIQFHFFFFSSLAFRLPAYSRTPTKTEVGPHFRESPHKCRKSNDLFGCLAVVRHRLYNPLEKINRYPMSNWYLMFSTTLSKNGLIAHFNLFARDWHEQQKKKKKKNIFLIGLLVCANRHFQLQLLLQVVLDVHRSSNCAIKNSNHHWGPWRVR